MEIGNLVREGRENRSRVGQGDYVQREQGNLGWAGLEEVPLGYARDLDGRVSRMYVEAFLV